jgi:TonB family protein
MTSERTRNWVDGITHRLIHRAARRAPESLSERLEEEWLADSAQQGGPIMRLRFAFGCCWATNVIAHEYGVAAIPAAGSAAVHGPLIRHPEEDHPFFTGHTITFVLVAFLHVAVIYSLAMGLGPQFAKTIIEPLCLCYRVIDPPQRESLPLLPRPVISTIPFVVPALEGMPPIEPGREERAEGSLPEPARALSATQAVAVAALVNRMPGGLGIGFPSAEDFYPKTSIRRGENGTATVNACVDANGRLVSEPTIILSSGSTRLDASALKLAKAGSGHYRAATEDGRPVSSCYPFRIRFELRD